MTQCAGASCTDSSHHEKPQRTAKEVLDSFTEADFVSMFQAIEPFVYKTNGRGEKVYLIPYSMKKDIEKDFEINVFINSLMTDGRALWGRPMTRKENRARRNKVKKLW